MEHNSLIDEYKRYLLLEKNLSKNTINAYLTDVRKFNSFVEAHQLTYQTITYNHLEEFVAELYERKIAPRSVARIISGVKSFFRFLVLNEYISDNPAELLEVPKIGLKLPVVLSLEEIDSILGVIDVSTVEGTRNYAIIETLYSCGLRVSELINLKFSDLFFDEGFIRVEGKGSKQRLVPISDVAIQK